MIALIVREPFQGYVYGEKITDKTAVDAALQEHPDKVLKVAATEPVKAPAKK